MVAAAIERKSKYFRQLWYPPNVFFYGSAKVVMSPNVASTLKINDGS
jgi:hypothetical protein